MNDGRMQSAWRTCEVVRIAPGGASARADDDLGVEEPLEIRVNGASLAVLMRTPGEERELAAGFLITEAIVQGAREIASIEVARAGDGRGNVVGVALAPGAAFDPDKLKRNFYAGSSCGMCGKASIESVRLAARPLDADWRIAAAALAEIPARLRATQSAFDRTGSLHGAAIFDLEGVLVSSAEDVGRHNAVDKAVGRAALADALPLSRAILAVSGRISFEIAQKALMAGLPMIVAVSGATTLAVELAEEAGMTLAGFAREGGMTVYSGAARIDNGAEAMK